MEAVYREHCLRQGREEVQSKLDRANGWLVTLILASILLLWFLLASVGKVGDLKARNNELANRNFELAQELQELKEKAPALQTTGP